MRKFNKKQIIVGGVAAAAIAIGAGAAYAYWTNGGTGNGTETTGTTSSFTVTVDKLTDANLSPGGPVDTLNYSVQNNDSGVEKMSSDSIVVTTNKDGCTSDDFAVTDDNFAAGTLQPNGATGDTANFSFKVQMVNRDVPQDACQNATVSFAVTVS